MFFARKKRNAAMKETIDRLGAVRDALRILKAREAELLQELQSYRPGNYARGDSYELERRKKKTRRFDRMALPQHIREDEAHWKTEITEVLTFVPLDPSQKAPTADQIADTYAETYDLPIGLPAEEANYGQTSQPSGLPEPAAPLVGPPETADVETPDRALAAAEPSQTFDFAGVPRYRTGGKVRKDQ